MATLILKATGNFTAAGTWNVADPTAELDDETASTATTTSYVSSSNFTPGAITIIGLAVKIASKTSGGTFSVNLRNTTGGIDIVSVTVNVADVPASGWLILPIASTLLIAATTYAIQIKSSTNATVTCYRNGTANNWSRQLYTATTAAPASTDKLIVAGSNDGSTISTFTVTMDNTATTSFGPTWTSDAATPGGIQVCKGGTITWGTTASTNYYLKWKGRFAIYDQGIVNVGTSGTRIPATSTTILEMDSAANVDTGLVALAGGILNIYANNSRNRKAKLTADAAAAATSLTLDNTAGWLTAGASPWGVGDDLVFFSTTRTNSQVEARVVSTVPGGMSATITSGLTNAHSGTSPTQGEVINLTSNVRIRGISTSLQGYVLTNTTSVINIDNAEFYQLGSATSTKTGITLNNTSGAVSITNCSIHDFIVSGSIGITMVSSGTSVMVQNNVLYNLQSIGISAGSLVVGGLTLDGNWGAKSQFQFVDGIPVAATITNNVFTSGAAGIFLSNTGTGFGVQGTISGNITHSNSGNGLQFYGSGNWMPIVSSHTSWRNGGAGVAGSAFLNQLAMIQINNLTAFGNTTYNVDITNGNMLLVLNNPTLNGDSTFATTNGVGVGFNTNVTVNIGNLGTVSGIKIAHTNDINIANTFIGQVLLNNTILASATEIANQANIIPTGVVNIQRNDTTAGSHRSLVKMGTLAIETTIYKTASPSLKMTALLTNPSNLDINRLTIAACVPAAGSLYRVVSGATVSPSVFVRKDSSYNGNAPRLILKANHSLGVTTDTVLSTFSAAADIWQQLTGTTTAATDDGVFEFVVDCDGTAGNIYVDDWAGS